MNILSFRKRSEPKPAPEPVIEDDSEYARLLACYRSGQMNAAQLKHHMDSDHGFRAYVREFERCHANAWRV